MALAVSVLFFTIAPRVGDLALGYFKQGSDCKVTHIVDGDTVSIKCPDKIEDRARIMGLDTAETDANCYAEWVMAVRAKWALRWLVWRARNVTMESHGTDRYRRILIVLKIDGVDVAGQLIAMDLARPYEGGRRASWCDS